MGVVHAAIDQETGEGVAIKLLKNADAELRRRLAREARAVMAIDHPHVVAVRAVLELDDGAPALVMDRLEGRTLAARLAEAGKLALGDVARIALPVASALGAAHALGIVHRDLKPENVFLARTGAEEVVKVLDFGIAKVPSQDGAGPETVTATAAILGTPRYMAPEHVLGERDIDHRADIWSLGVILYQCLTGIVPTDAENVGADAEGDSLSQVLVGRRGRTRGAGGYRDACRRHALAPAKRAAGRHGRRARRVRASRRGARGARGAATR
jgi:serine/threonine protein kinase